MIVNNCIKNVKSYVMIEKSCIEIMNEIINMIKIKNVIEIKIEIEKKSSLPVELYK